MPKRAPRLQFTEEEQQNPALKNAIKKADRAADKLGKEESKIPVQKKIVKERTTEPKTGKSVVRLRFEDMEKKPPSKLSHAIRHAPGSVLSSQFHREMRESDDGNAGVSTADGTISATETVYHTALYAHRSHQLKPYRAASYEEKQVDKANLNTLQKEIQQQTTSNTNAYSRWQQKKAIKQEYAKAKHTSEYTAKASEIASKAAAAAAEKSKQAIEFVKKNWKMVLIVMALAVLLMFVMGIISSCSMMFQGVLGGFSVPTYQSKPEDMTAVESAYRSMEIDLQQKIDNYEALHPGYNEYRISGTVLGHDPYVLTSLLSAIFEEYALSDVQGMLDTLFDSQYRLTETVVTETRYRTEVRTGYHRVHNPNTGESYLVPYTYEVQVPYDYTICTVTLTSTPMDDLANGLLTDEQMELYEIYLETKGNYPDLFAEEAVMMTNMPSSELAHIAAASFEPDAFSQMKAEAERYLGYPFVWGGSSPETSFDCSGYVSWVANHSGWNIGRLNAQGLFNICTPVSVDEVQPGDLVFFKGTFATYGISHVGIFAGNNEMLHAGNPISYADLTLPYWQRHFYAYGRLPEQ